MSAGSYCKRMPWGQQKPPLGYGIDWSHPLATGIVGCWLFNEGAGKSANDLTKYNINNNGILSASQSWESNAIRFSGVGYDGINIGNSINIYKSMTIIVDLTEMPPLSGEDYNYFTRSGFSGNRGVLCRLNYHSASQSHYALFAVSSDATTQITMSSEPSPKYTKPGIFANVYNSNTAIMSIYFNGILQQQKTTGVPSTQYMPGVCWYIGARNPADSQPPFMGKMNSASILDRALSPSEVAQLYETPYCFIEGWNYARFISIPSSAFILSPYWQNQAIQDAA